LGLAYISTRDFEDISSKTTFVSAMDESQRAIRVEKLVQNTQVLG